MSDLLSDQLTQCSDLIERLKSLIGKQRQLLEPLANALPFEKEGARYQNIKRCLERGENLLLPLIENLAAQVEEYERLLKEAAET